VKHAVSGERFQKAFFDNATDEKLRAYVSSVLGK
jgi:ribose 5-phosphate isomerase B